jgi:RNA polymerase sigma-70 factor (ECF subfamily)
LWRVCRRIVGDDADASDALQDALVAIARGIRRFDGRSAFTTWSYRVATNACLDEVRRRGRRPVPDGLGTRDRGDLGDDRGPDRLEPRSWTGAGITAGDRTGGVGGVAGRLDVDAAVAQLPPEFRAAVVLRDLCDLDYAEIARVLDVPVGTVRSRIARGRARLADLLGNPSPRPERPTTAS